MKKLILAMVIMAFAMVSAYAHTPLMSCFDNGDGTVTCEGGFSDGSSASGVKMHVVSDSGKTLLSGKMSEDSEFVYKKPEGQYKVIFDAGEGHTVEVKGSEIAE